jgi:nitrogen PTS system EIIA component
VSSTNPLAALLAINDISLDFAAGSKRRLFEHVAANVEAHHGISASTVIESLLARERLGSTGFGEGVAIPHGRLKGLSDAIGVFVRASAPIGFDAPDGKPVDQIFALLVPENATDHHLMILSELAQRFSEKRFRDAVRNASTAQEIHTLFCGA